MPGPGDPVTWPRSTNHPNDPRRSDTGLVIEHMQESDDWDPCGLPLSETMVCDRDYPCADCVDEYIQYQREAAEDAKAERIMEERRLGY